MTLPSDYTLRAGNYREKSSGRVFYFCNCSKQASNRTLRWLGANRGLFEVYPPPVQKDAQNV
jgi:hypothetical protein